MFEETNRDWNGEKYDNENEFLATDGNPHANGGYGDPMLSRNICAKVGTWSSAIQTFDRISGRHGLFE